MTMSDREKLARQWAEETRDNFMASNELEEAAAEHILATTTPPTMEDVEWDHEKHYLAGAVFQNAGTGTTAEVVMFHKDGSGAIIAVDVEDGRPFIGDASKYSPNGKRYGLREVGAGEPDVRRARALVEDLARDHKLVDLTDGKLARVMNEVLDALAPEKPDHPEVLETIEDYRDAPVGTVVTRTTGGGVHMKYGADDWRYTGLSGSDTDFDMAGSLHRVLRWRGGEA